jgi:hypothetical protein
VQTKSVNSNAIDDMFVAFNIVQQIMKGLSDSTSEKDKVVFITKAVLRLLKGNGGNSS